MTQIGSFDLEKKTAVVAVILEKPLENSKKAAEKGADILEIRLDLLGIRNPERAAEVIREIKAETGIPIIVTSRSGAEGGKWDGKEEDRTGLLINLLSLKDGPDAIDIELSAGMKERNRVIKAAKDRETAVIVSSHDFFENPSPPEHEDNY